MIRMAAGAVAILGMVVMGSGAVGAQTVAIDRSAVASATALREGRTGGASLGGCPMFPADNPWNTDISRAPLRANSAAIIARIQRSGAGVLRADFGEDPAYGIPFVVVPRSQPEVPIRYDAYGDESEPGPFPIPLDAPIEGGGDRHVLVLRQEECRLYELYIARRSGAGWLAASGARFDLRSNALRPDGWTSADAAGLPILPGLARCDEVTAGSIDHALRVTFTQTRRRYVYPATHQAGSSDEADLPAMGQRLRLKASFDTARFAPQARVILDAAKKYGLIVADNGSNWFVSGAPGSCWNDADLIELRSVPGTAFEAVDTGPYRP